MAAIPPRIPDDDHLLLHRLGERLRLARKHRRLSETALAQRAGIARATLQRAELGEPTVAMGTYLRILRVLEFQRDLEQVAALDLLHPVHQAPPAPARNGPAGGAVTAAARPRPERVRVRVHAQLRQLAWQLRDDAELTPAEALGLYERNWRYVDQGALNAAERAFIERLKNEQGNGVMLV